MANDYYGTPNPGIFGQTQVDWDYLHTLLKDSVEMINAAADFQWVSKFVADTDKKTIRHNNRSFDWIGVAGDFIPQETQRAGFWYMPMGLYTYGDRLEFSISAMANDMQDYYAKSIADIARGYERLQTKLAYKVMLNDGSAAVAGSDIQTQSGFWNGAVSVTGAIPKWKEQSHGATHTHYNGSGDGATFQLSDLSAMVEHIQHHGYLPAQRNAYTFINSNGAKNLKDLFAPTIMQTPTPVTSQIITDGIDDMDTGLVIHGTRLISDDWLPNYYYLTLSDLVPIVARRVPFNPSFRGMQVQKDNLSDNPMLGSKYWTQLGHLVAEKGAGAVVYSASSTWTDPTLSTTAWA